MRALCAQRRRKQPRERDRDAEHVLGHRPCPNPARGGQDHRAVEQFPIHQAPDAGGRALHPPQADGRSKGVPVDIRRERDIGLRQQDADHLAIAGFDEGVLRNIRAETIPVMPGHHPCRRGADDGDENDHDIAGLQEVGIAEREGIRPSSFPSCNLAIKTSCNVTVTVSGRFLISRRFSA